MGKIKAEIEAVGTYAKQILTRLLIDLLWNSSRLGRNLVAVGGFKPPTFGL
jgi:ABC-type glucose/galactose transport system permease subunit